MLSALVRGDETAQAVGNLPYGFHSLSLLGSESARAPLTLTARRSGRAPPIANLAASTLADQLGGKHPESAAVTLGVLKHRLCAAEVDPLAIFAHHADQAADARGTVGDERQ